MTQGFCPEQGKEEITTEMQTVEGADLEGEDRNSGLNLLNLRCLF